MLFVLEETADRNVIDVVETNNSPTFTTILANLLNKASSGLGVLHDTVGVPIEKEAKSVKNSVVDLYHSVKEKVSSWNNNRNSTNVNHTKKRLIATTAVTALTATALLTHCPPKPPLSAAEIAGTETKAWEEIAGTETRAWAETERPKLEKTWAIDNITKTFQFELTETAKFFTPEPDPVNNPDLLNTNINLWLLANSLDKETSQYCQQEVSNLDSDRCKQLLDNVYASQNRYNEIILNEAVYFSEKYSGIDPLVLAVIFKRIIINEAQFDPTVVSDEDIEVYGTGLAQLTPDTLETIINNGYFKIPDNININIKDTETVIQLLQDPELNVRASMAYLVYLHEGFTQKNQSNGWNMAEDDIWKFIAGMYNLGAQSSEHFVAIDPTGQDFWENGRLAIQNRNDWYEIYFCNDPESWDCIKYLFPNAGDNGRCTILYAESVVPDAITENPVVTEIINDPPYDRKECE